MKAKDALELRRIRIAETFQLDPVVPMTLKGQHLKLEFNNYAVKKILLDCGVNLLQTGFTREHMLDPAILESVLFRGLEAHQPSITPDEASKLYTFRHTAYVFQCLSQALDLFSADVSDLIFDDPAEEDENPLKPPTPIG